jgi:hypothetical protein
MQLRLGARAARPQTSRQRGDWQVSTGHWNRFLSSQQPDRFLMRTIRHRGMMALTNQRAPVRIIQGTLGVTTY